MYISIVGADFFLQKNDDSRKEVYPYILNLFMKGVTITIFLEEHEYQQLRGQMIQI